MGAAFLIIFAVGAIYLLIYGLSHAGRASRPKDFARQAVAEMREEAHRAIREAYEQGRAEGLRAADDYRHLRPTRRSEHIKIDMAVRRPPVPTAGLEDAVARLRRQNGAPVEVTFSGWPNLERARLRELATDAGWRVRANVGQHVAFLVLGDTPGEVKMDLAKERGTLMISGDVFERLICEPPDQG